MERWRSAVLTFLLLNPDFYVYDAMSDGRWLHCYCDFTYVHKREVCMYTNHPLTVWTDIYFTWLSAKYVDAYAKYYMCT